MSAAWGPEGPPRLSPSTAKVLLKRSALHAFTQHRLGGGEQTEQTEATTRGRIVDRMLLGAGPDIVVIDAKDWRTNAAKEARDAAEAAGKLPLLAHKQAEYAEVVQAWKAQLVRHDIEFTGESQVKLDWESMGVPCRGKLDHLIVTPTGATIYDLKSCDDASREAVTRAVVGYGHDVQHAAYIEAVEAAYPQFAGRVKMALIFGETERVNAYAVNVVTLGGTMRELGERKWRRAKAIWGRCLETGEFPGYEDALPLEATPWQLAAEQEAQLPGGDKETPF